MAQNQRRVEILVGADRQTRDVSLAAKSSTDIVESADFLAKSKQPPIGLEPKTCGLQNRCDRNVSPSDSSSSNIDTRNLADHLALLIRESPDLAVLVDRWSFLPDPVRAGIVALVEAVQSSVTEPPPQDR